MSGQFLGQIGFFGFNFAPVGWANCSGQILPISQNTALFSLLGTFYGGNGTSNFALPDLRSRTPIHQGTGGGGTYVIGETGGTETVTLTINSMPLHAHPFQVTNAAAAEFVASATTIFGQASRGKAPGTPENFYGPNTPNVTLSPQTVGNTGGSQPHNNIQPSLVANFCIALQGVFPARN
jgi:microcystin-dependent protein